MVKLGVDNVDFLSTYDMDFLRTQSEIEIVKDITMRDADFLKELFTSNSNDKEVIPVKVTFRMFLKKDFEYDFSGCDRITSIEISSYDQDILSLHKFCGCKNLTEVILRPITFKDDHIKYFSSNGVVYSGNFDNKFYKMLESSNLECYKVPECCHAIMPYAFENCKALTTLSFSKIRFIYESAFKNSGIEKIFIKYDYKPHIYPNTFDGLDQSKVTLFVPIGTKAEYMMDLRWNKFKIYEMDKEMMP